MTARSYCITSYNVDQYDPKHIDNVILSNDYIRYFVYQLEECPETHRHHIQGYIELNQGYRITKIKSTFSDSTMHLEKRKGTRDEARNYCMKSETRLKGPWEFGEWNKGSQGKRNDLAIIAKDIKDGKQLHQIAEDYPATFMRNYRGINEYITITGSYQKRTWRTQGVILFGDSHTGKSFKARQIAFEAGYKDSDIYDLRRPDSKSQCWWQKYTGQPIIIIDEFYGWLQFDLVLRLLDENSNLDVDTKGSSVTFLGKHIIFTSNVHPRSWWDPKIISDKRFEAFANRINLYGECWRVTGFYDAVRVSKNEITHEQASSAVTWDRIQL